MVKKIQAAGGIVFQIDHEEVVTVLLIYRNGCWDLPKGKLEKGESIEMCASREVSEETGSKLPMHLGDLGTTYHEYTQKGVDYGKTTFWYVMVLPQITKFIPQKKENIEYVEWVPLTEAIQKVGFENLKLILHRFQKWMA
jgi:8-oxo-dGTP pyrophosphatase MutT (NUDIX family)